MAQEEPRSLQDIIRQRQQSKFVGRAEQLDAFRANLDRPPHDPQRLFIFNIYGQGGVGKSTLLQEYRSLAKRAGAAAALSDEEEKSIPAALARLAEQLEEQGHDFDNFLKRYRVYRQKREELEADPEAPQGLAVFMGRTATHITLHALKQTPGVGGVVEMVDNDAAAEQVGQWTEFVRRRLTNKDERRLVLEPKKALTPLFIKGLVEVARKNTAVLMFDTFERTGAFLDKWLRRTLEREYGDLPMDLTLVIAGRDALNPDHWLSYEEVMLRIELNPFTETEARKYLARQEIRDEKIISVILELSGRLPLLVATLAAQRASDPDEVGTAVGTAIARFLKWVDDNQRRQLALDGSLPRLLNRDVIACLLPDAADIDTLFSWLKAMPFVLEREQGWTYHEMVRAQMMRYKRRESDDSWSALHEKLSEYYAKRIQLPQLDWEQGVRDEEWSQSALSALYHRLCGRPNESVKDALIIFLDALKEKPQFAKQWAMTIHQAGADSENKTVEEWGNRLNSGLRAYEDSDYVEASQMFSRLLEQAQLPEEQQAIVYSWRGEVNRLASIHGEALADFDRAIELDEEHAWAIAQRGETYRQMERNDEALTDFNRAVELDDEYAWAIASRGQTYRQMEQYEKALTDFNRAVELDDEYAWAFAQRAVTYRQMEQYEKALADFSRAVELDDEYAWALGQRAAIYWSIQKYDKALAHFDRAVDVDEENAWLIAGRGLTYVQMEDYEKALDDFDRAIELDDEYAGAITSRGGTYRLMEKYEEALADFDRAIQLDDEYVWAIASRGQTYQAMEKYKEALADFDRAIELNEESPWAFAQRGETYRLMAKYEEAIADYREAIRLEPENRFYYNNLALVYLDARQLTKAKEYYEKRVSRGSEDSMEAHVNLGMIAYYKNDRDAASEHFGQALASWTVSWERELQAPYKLLRNKAVGLLGLGRVEEAIGVLEEGLSRRGQHETIDEKEVARYAELLLGLDGLDQFLDRLRAAKLEEERPNDCYS